MGKKSKDGQVLAPLIGFGGGIIVVILTAFLTPLGNYIFESKKVKQLEAEVDSLKARYSELDKKYHDLLESKDDFYRVRIAYQLEVIQRQVQKDFEEGKVPVIEILGINATGHLHQGLELLKEGLNRGAKIRILLLDPTSQAFLKRSKEENDGVGRIAAELQASLYILADIQKQVGDTKSSNLELRLHSNEPDRSLIMIDADTDRGVIMENPYPKLQGKRGVEQRKRGVEGEMYQWLQKGKDARGYRENLAYFKDLWHQAKTVKLMGMSFNPTTWPYEGVP